MVQRLERRPDTAACGNPKCSNSNLDLSNYRSSYPRDEVEQVRIHWCAYPVLDGDVLFCTCGHYTIFVSGWRTHLPNSSI